MGQSESESWNCYWTRTGGQPLTVLGLKLSQMLQRSGCIYRNSVHGGYWSWWTGLGTGREAAKTKDTMSLEGWKLYWRVYGGFVPPWFRKAFSSAWFPVELGVPVGFKLCLSSGSLVQLSGYQTYSPVFEAEVRLPVAWMSVHVVTGKRIRIDSSLVV